MRKIFFVLVLFSFFINSYLNLFGGSAGKNYTYETQEIVLFPTAGLLSNSDLFNLKFFGNNVVVLSVETIAYKDLAVGVSLALEDFLGNGRTSFLDYPAIKIKYRFLNEAKYYPAIVVGFDSENYLDIPVNTNNYNHHSIGPYIVASKAFSWEYGIIGIHLGANYPIRYNPNWRGNFFLGFEHSFGKFATTAIEYNFDCGYNRDGSIEKGTLNLGLKYSIDKNVTINFSLIDFLSTNYSSYKTLNLQFTTKLF